MVIRFLIMSSLALTVLNIYSSSAATVLIAALLLLLNIVVFIGLKK